MPRAAFITLGCKQNQFETQAMELMLASRGWESAPAHETADVYIVNTCAVTGTAGKKSRQELRQARKRSPSAIIAACGCFSEYEGEALLRDGIADVAAGNRDHAAFIDAVEKAYFSRARQEASENGESAAPEMVGENDRDAFETLPAGSLDGRTRALLKLEDGCRNYCAYCIIPYLRGSVRSIDPDFAASEAARLDREGFREIVLTGIEISSYGLDNPAYPRLPELVGRLCAAAPDARIRLGSLEPRTADSDFVERLRAVPNLCPHFHLSLQSGSDGVLRRMGRKYDTALYAAAADRLRAAFPDCSITTDIIVGFPGETDAEFAETMAFCERIGFERAHIFPYSRREGTRAAKMPGQILNSVKEERASALAGVTAKTAARGLLKRVGLVESVLFETGREGVDEGYTGSYLPVELPRTGFGLAGEFADVLITGAESGRLTGEIVRGVAKNR